MRYTVYGRSAAIGSNAGPFAWSVRLGWFIFIGHPLSRACALSGWCSPQLGVGSGLGTAWSLR
jgi:hypothetical protein